jgi:hypothetical protein
LYDPLNPQPATGAVPLKVALCDVDGNEIRDAQNVLTAIKVVDLNDPAVILGPSPNDTGKANDGYDFRSQSGGKSYIYNLNVDELIDQSTGQAVEITAGEYALGFVVNEDVQFDANGLPIEPVGGVLYFANFTLKD